MNKHAQNLRTMLALLPPEVCHVYRDTIHNAAIEIDRLDTALRGQNYNLAPTYHKPSAPPNPPKVKDCKRIDGGADCLSICDSQCANAVMEQPS